MLYYSSVVPTDCLHNNSITETTFDERSQAYCVNSKVPAKQKGRLCMKLDRPLKMYGIETVAVTKMQECKMNVAEMKMLHFSLGKIGLDKMKNHAIGVGETRTKQRETGLSWLGHVV